MRARANVWFASRVIENTRYHKGHSVERSEIEQIVRDNPLAGREFVAGIPAIRALNKQFHGEPYVLTWVYLIIPTADFMPCCENDEVVFFDVRAVTLVTKQILTDWEIKKLKREVSEFYSLTMETE
jgi:hypothetical protein